MYYISKRIEIAFAHRLCLNYESKCTRLHGHSGIVTVYCCSKELNENGMVLEYSMSDLARADRAAVEEQIAAGVSASEAEALYLTDEYFENWYQSLCTKLSAYEG